MSPVSRRRDLVRPYVVTGGRARPSRNTLDLVTLLTAVPGRPAAALGPEARAMVELCRGGYLAVVDLAAHLALPLSVTRVLIADLLDSGHLAARNTHRPAGTPADRDTLERLLDALHAL
ncbi:DUF742 domain-containing protein [Streptomyces aidingensis]|uniref:DUF742 domain-containing protein n=1 Tax=Streptomyces aidingensis TaxID=910347 RepID=A0A1I1VAQ4_9ACTN|nr:DUF742 domain-containing protein [Streptomyces aidingensis]SFD80046.1 Protein of unknown function [Streptomyces aidingensis]